MKNENEDDERVDDGDGVVQMASIDLQVFGWIFLVDDDLVLI